MTKQKFEIKMVPISCIKNQGYFAIIEDGYIRIFLNNGMSRDTGEFLTVPVGTIRRNIFSEKTMWMENKEIRFPREIDVIPL